MTKDWKDLLQSAAEEAYSRLSQNPPARRTLADCSDSRNVAGKKSWKGRAPWGESFPVRICLNIFFPMKITWRFPFCVACNPYISQGLLKVADPELSFYLA